LKLQARTASGYTNLHMGKKRARDASTWPCCFNSCVFETFRAAFVRAGNKAEAEMDVDAPGSSGRAAAKPSAADEPASPMAADDRKRPAQSSGALGVRKHGKAGKRGALSHKQKRREAQALEKVSLHG